MNRKDSVRKPSDSNTRMPVTMPPNVVCTPDALLTAVRVNDPVTGIDWKNEPKMLHRPSASISWVASTVLPLAENKDQRNERFMIHVIMCAFCR